VARFARDILCRWNTMWNLPTRLVVVVLCLNECSRFIYTERKKAREESEFPRFEVLIRGGRSEPRGFLGGGGVSPRKEPSYYARKTGSKEEHEYCKFSSPYLINLHYVVTQSFHRETPRLSSLFQGLPNHRTHGQPKKNAKSRTYR
jgi:hypothetical protein